MNKSLQKQPIHLCDYKPPVFLVNKIDLIFELGDVTKVTSTIQFKLNPANREPPICKLYGNMLETKSVKLDGVSLTEKDYSIDSNCLTLFSIPDSFCLETEVYIRPSANTALSGLYLSNGNFCTQCEAEGFRRITWFPDRPDVMAIFTTSIIADKKLYPIMLSNGNILEKGHLDDGRHWVKWVDPFKKPSYLFALVAGDFDCIEDKFITSTGREIALRLFVEKGELTKTQHALRSLKKAMSWDEVNYGREYDLDVYMIVAIHDFNMGAMENKGLNIFNTRYVLVTPESSTDKDYINVESVIAHEYFHNWSGNRVTCRDWFQLSLKEGLTVFRDQTFTEDMTSASIARINDVDCLRDFQFIEDSGPLAHPVQPSSYMEINNFYTATVYNKGAEIVRMIRTIIGVENFRRGMDIYFKKYDGFAVTIDEFISSHEKAAGINLSQFKLWYTQAGTPSLYIKEEYDAGSQIYTLTIKQTCTATPGQENKLPFYIPIKIGLLSNGGEELLDRLCVLSDIEQQFKFKNISSHPIPSLLRDFSAPVIVKFDYSDDDLEILIKHDKNKFNQREAIFQYITRCLLRRISGSPSSRNPLLKIIKYTFNCLQSDPWFLSCLLELPSEKYLGEQMDIIAVDSIHHAREKLRLEIAIELKNEFYQTWKKLALAESIGERSLKNTCISYLSLLGNTETIDLIKNQFESSLAINMTDTMAALSEIINIENKFREEALEIFYKKWKEDALVIDKWFALQAGARLPDTLQRIKRLVEHCDFNYKNPNRVYALLNTFGNNSIIFHAKDGSGYRFLFDCVLKLDALNPQIAARILMPLTRWQKYDESRKHLMRNTLSELFQQKNLSTDVFELVSKSLEVGVMV